VHRLRGQRLCIEGPFRPASLCAEAGLVEHQLLEETARLRASLLENETHSRELLENSVYGIFRVGFDGTFSSANDTLLRILACSSFPKCKP